MPSDYRRVGALSTPQVDSEQIEGPAEIPLAIDEIVSTLRLGREGYGGKTSSELEGPAEIPIDEIVSTLGREG